ncbi:MAG TPA: GNAT family N-acetyltransferase, partial [Longimicrobium sp.]|nr:GNAT family N-acetyltransferase [Longimicrobium sp.]
WAGFDALLDASAAEGFRFLARLRDEHASGRNRFDAEGEVLLGAFRGGELVGVGGLNRDPYSGDPRTGRIRHLYVLPTHRRHGTGRRLTGELLAHARHWFDRVVLRTDTAAAARFYEALGFAPEPRIPGATHSVALTANSPHAEPAEG